LVSNQVVTKMIFADSEQITTGGVATGQGGKY